MTAAAASLRLSPDLDLPLDVVTEAIGIVGTRGSGKTYASVVLIEEAFAAGVQVVVLDPTGVYHGLRSSASGKGDGLPVYVLGGPHGDLPLEPGAGTLLADTVVDSGHSFVLDLSDLSKGATRGFSGAFLERLYERKARNRSSLLLVVDEADELAPQTIRKMTPEAARCLGAVESIAKRGRSRGVGIVLISQRTQAINKDVLDLIETLLAMRISAPRSRSTVKEWLDVKEADDDQGVLSSLSALPTGTAWVWSPVRGLLERVKVRRIRTFDSYKTPRAGEQRAEPVRRASLDLDALGEQMAATVERVKANDPQELKRRVSELERDLAATRLATHDLAPPAPPVEVEVEVHVPVFPDELRDAIRTDYEGIERDAQLLLDKIVGAARKRLERLDADWGLALSRTAPVPPARAPERPAALPEAPAPARTETARPASAEPRRAHDPAPSRNGDRATTGPQQKILDAIAWWNAVRVPVPTRKQLAFVAGYHPNTKGFVNSLSTLSTAGLVGYPQPGSVALTDAGRALAELPRATPTESDLRELIYEQVGAARSRVLRELLGAHTYSMTRVDLAAVLGYHPNTKGFVNNLSRLSTLGLVYYPVPGHVALTPLMFL